MPEGDVGEVLAHDTYEHVRRAPPHTKHKELHQIILINVIKTIIKTVIILGN